VPSDVAVNARGRDDAWVELVFDDGQKNVAIARRRADEPSGTRSDAVEQR
jgi:hypothetical protein